MTSADLLPVHRDPVWSVIVQTDRNGHSTPSKLKVMSSGVPGLSHDSVGSLVHAAAFEMGDLITVVTAE